MLEPLKMNKNDRRKLRTAARRYCSLGQQASEVFKDTVEVLQTSEEEKLDNLPESLQTSSQAQNIESAIDDLNTILEALESSENAFEEIADIIGIDIVELPAYTTLDSDKEAPRNRRFQILLTDQIMGKLKQRSLETGLSCNEIICQAISKYLATETD